MRTILLTIWITLGLGAAFARAESEPECRGFFQRLYLNVHANARVFYGTATSKLDEFSYATFEKARLNPDAEITVGELAHLREAGLDVLFQRYQKANRLTKRINQLMALDLRSQPIKTKAWANWKRNMLDLASTYFLPGIPAGPTSRAKRIFEKALRDMNFSLPEEQVAFLKKWNLWDDFERFASESKEHREGYLQVTRARQIGNGLRWGVIGTAAAGTALAPYIGAERVNSEEELREKLAETRGGVQWLFSQDPALPSMLRTENEAVVFGMFKAKFYRGEKLREFDELLAKNRTNYNRVFFRADAGEAKKVMDQAKEFVSRTRVNAAGEKELSQRSYLDQPMAETYKILRSELGLPPVPLVKRDEAMMLAHFGLMRRLGDPDTGRVRRVLRVRENEKSEGELGEAARGALSAYFNGIFYAGAGSAFFTLPVLGLDALPTTRMQTDIPLERKRDESSPGATAGDNK